MTNENLAEKYQGKEKEWSVMVYLAGGMDVTDKARESLLRMKQIRSKDLRPGDYVLKLSGMTAGGDLEDIGKYYFRLTPK
jgi:hypothetical protein